MPELPEVEVLRQHLQAELPGRIIRRIVVNRAKVLRPGTPPLFVKALAGARVTRVTRRGKYLLFHLRPRRTGKVFSFLGHLGMTGRIYLQRVIRPLPKHAAVVFRLDRDVLIYEDPRYFGRLSLDTSILATLGPEPLAGDFTIFAFAAKLKKSRQAIKVKLLDQVLVAGIGNIYASEALHRAGINPLTAACRLSPTQTHRLWRAIRTVLRNAIRGGSTVPLDWSGRAGQDRLFYFGRPAGAVDFYTERLRVYDRAGQPCPVCRSRIRRMTQAGRSTYFCPRCQR